MNGLGFALTAAAHAAIEAVGAASPEAPERLDDLKRAINRVHALPRFHNAYVRDLAGRAGGWLLTVHGLDSRLQRPRMLSLLQGIRSFAVDIQSDLETRIPPPERCTAALH
jgi:hypothetical protein